MPSINLQTSKQFREFSDISVSGSKSPVDSMNKLHSWRADIFETIDQRSMYLYTNEFTLYSIIIEDDGEDPLPTFFTHFHNLLEGTTHEFRLSDLSLTLDSTVNYSLIASMNHIRILIDHKIDQGSDFMEVNTFPNQKLEYSTPTESLGELLKTDFG